MVGAGPCEMKSYTPQNGRGEIEGLCDKEGGEERGESDYGHLRLCVFSCKWTRMVFFLDAATN